MAQAKSKKLSAPKRVSKVPENETKSAKFQRLANQRVTKALKAIKQVQNLSGVSYESTDEQRGKIVSALSDGVDSVRDSFAGKTKAQTTFQV